MPNIVPLPDIEPPALRQAVNSDACEWFTLRRLGSAMLMAALTIGSAPSARAGALEDAAAQYRPYMIKDVGQSQIGRAHV